MLSVRDACALRPKTKVANQLGSVIGWGASIILRYRVWPFARGLATRNAPTGVMVKRATVDSSQTQRESGLE
jgi:hypothetical protein